MACGWGNAPQRQPNTAVKNRAHSRSFHTFPWPEGTKQAIQEMATCGQQEHDKT
jgi:hypothetical protein